VQLLEVEVDFKKKIVEELRKKKPERSRLRRDKRIAIR